MTGLCGNFNNDGADDQRAPSGLIHPSAALFGDSWRLHSYCPRAVPVQDTCSIYSHRKHWAIKKCSILKSDVFQTCHTEVYPSWPTSYKRQSDHIGPFPGPSIPLPVSVCYRHLWLQCEFPLPPTQPRQACSPLIQLFFGFASDIGQTNIYRDIRASD